MKRRLFFSILLVIVLSFWAIRPLLVPGFFPMHDDTQPARVQQMAKSLSYGQFPVRWLPDLGYGYGYPLFNFYAPLPYYIGGLIHLIGIDVITAAKLMFIIGILLSAVSMFILVNFIAGSLAGTVSSILYMYAPFHAVNIYIRGAVGELYGYAFLPFVMMGMLKIIRSKKEYKRGILTGSIGLAGLLLSHNILGMITLYFLTAWLFLYLIYKLIKRQNIFIFYYLLFVILLGVGLSSFFTIPAILEKKYTRADELVSGGSNFRNHFVYIDQLWNSDWGFAGSAAGRADGMSFRIGKTHLILGVISLTYALYLFIKKKIKAFNLFVTMSQLILFILSVFFMLEWSQIIWEILPGFPFIQYPWRFLNFTILSISITSSVIFISLNKYLKITTAFLIILLILLFNRKYFVPQTQFQIKPEDYTSSENIRYKISKISDEYLPKEFELPVKQEDIAQQELLLVNTPTFKKYEINLLHDAVLNPDITYFPGWQAKIDDNSVAVMNVKGKISLFAPQGKHILTLEFTNTFVRLIGNTISFLSLFLLVYISLFLPSDKLWKR